MKDKLWTQSFICICVANFLLFFAFNMLLPILPLYLIEVFGANRTMVGVILSCYTVAALVVRPAAGFVLDIFSRRPLYLLAYFLFVLCFIGYPLVTTVGLFLLMRVLHGLTFGMLTTAGNSFVVDIMPSSRRGEGLGYFGVANNLAMATGPMLSLFLHESYDFNVNFYIAICSGALDFIMACTVRAKKKAPCAVAVPLVKQTVALDRFFLPQGMRASVSLMLTAVPYGILTTYVAIYGKELGIQTSMGLFFSLMAAGLIGSRLFAGKLVDRGKLSLIVSYGTAVAMAAFVVLSSLDKIGDMGGGALVPVLFYLVAITLGLGYGMLFPAYNTLFVNLAPHNRRATASSTYLTSWDIGIGIGLMAGGRIADTAGGLPLSFFVGSMAVVLSMLVFKKWTAPHYEKNKLHS